jgi:hypothetical protein
MKRRQFITLLGGAAAAWPLPARAQQSAGMRRVGVLMDGAATGARPQSHAAAFMQGLRQLGWIEGQNIHIDIRWNAGDAQLARIYAAQLIGLMPDVILASTRLIWRSSGRPPAQSRSYSCWSPIQSHKASLRPWRSRAATSPVSAGPSSRSVANGSICSRKSRPASPGGRVEV